MAHGSKMISRVLEEADRAIATARHFAPDVAAAWGALRPRVEGNLAPDLSVYLETVIERIEVLRERLSSAHLNRCTLRSRTLFQHDAVRAKADRVRYLLVDVRFQLDRVCGKGKGHADFEGRSDLQRIPIPQLERVSTSLLNLMRGNPCGWNEGRYRLEIAPLCVDLEQALLELKEEREVLRSAQGAQSHAYAERFRSCAADEKELREKIDVVRSLLRSSGRAEEARELRRIRPRPRREKSQRRSATPETAVKASGAPPSLLPQQLRELMQKRKPKRGAHRRRLQRWAAKRPRLPGTS